MRKIDRLKKLIYEYGILDGKEFKLSSGDISNYLFDLKPVMLRPEGANLIADIIIDRIKGIEGIGGLAVGAVPLISAVCAKSYWTYEPIKGFFVRKENKDHGTKYGIDGCWNRGMKAVIVDDVITRGNSILRAVNVARENGIVVEKAVVIIDRLNGGRELLKGYGIELDAIYKGDEFF